MRVCCQTKQEIREHAERYPVPGESPGGLWRCVDLRGEARALVYVILGVMSERVRWRHPGERTWAGRGQALLGMGQFVACSQEGDSRELLEERDRWRERAEELDLWAGSDGDRVRVSFDLGGLVTRAPRVLVPIIRALVASPEVDLLSLTDLDRGRAREVLDETGLGEIPDAALICASWDDGGELCKVEARRAHGIDLHVDDLLPYAQHCDLPDGRPGLGLVLMPSALPYRARSSRDG